jgi:hypothetical protein
MYSVMAKLASLFFLVVLWRKEECSYISSMWKIVWLWWWWNVCADRKAVIISLEKKKWKWER